MNLNSLQNNLTLDESNMLFSRKDQISNTNTNTNTNNQNNPNMSMSSNTNSYSSSSKEELIKIRRDTIRDIYKSEKEYLPCNFYVIYKIMYLFYKSNEKVYTNVEKSVEDEGIPFRKNLPLNLNAATSNTNRKSFFTFNTDNIKDNVNRINRISITNKEKLLSTKKFSLEQLMNSINDKVSAGFYAVEGATDTPSGMYNYGILLVLYSGDIWTYAIQIYIPVANSTENALYYRIQQVQGTKLSSFTGTWNKILVSA